MSRRKTKSPPPSLAPPQPRDTSPGRTGGGAGRTREGIGSVLVVSSDSQWRDALAGALAADGIGVELATTIVGARSILAAGRRAEDAPPITLAVVDMQLPDGAGLRLCDCVRQAGAGLVLASRAAGMEDTVAALRGGAGDLLAGSMPRHELVARVRAGLERARSHRERDARVARLRRVCRRLNSARVQVVRQVDALCTDLVQAYQEVAEQMNQVTTASEFGSLIRQELDVESLLRATLEFVLGKCGPTNAAIFLPTTSGDYSLGAYVNYDCPKETVDILLDHMANVIAPRFEDAPDLMHLVDPDEVEKHVAGDALWLGDSHVIAFPCRFEGECLAIFLLFRDCKTPYPEPLEGQLRTIRDLFARQLAKVIKIHHRHIPKDKWGALGDPEDFRDDYGDLAA